MSFREKADTVSLRLCDEGNRYFSFEELSCNLRVGSGSVGTSQFHAALIHVRLPIRETNNQRGVAPSGNFRSKLITYRDLRVSRTGFEPMTHALKGRYKSLYLIVLHDQYMSTFTVPQVSSYT